jgi:hypothetical protein
MHELSLIDNAFLKEDAGKCQLTIQADLNGFSFSVFDNRISKHVVFRRYFLQTNLLIESFLKQAEGILITDDLLSLHYASASCIFLTQKSTLVPDAFFDKNALKSYLGFNHGLDALDEIHYNYIPGADAYNVFALHTYIASAISSHLHGVRFYHQALPLIERTIALAGSKQKQIMMVNINHLFFDVILSSGGKLTLYNTFQYSGQNDILYFILYVCNQFEIDPQKLELVISGELSDIMAYREAIREYIPGIQILTGEGDNLAGGLVRVRESKFYALFNLVHCE